MLFSSDKPFISENISISQTINFTIKMTVADLLENDIKIIYSYLKCIASLCFLLGFEYVWR